MYQSLLTRRYLTSKVMPLLAALAVTLCCAMELIVWSVMGGFLTMLVDSGRTLIGDVEIGYENSGITYYDDLLLRLQRDSAVEAATPTIETYGLLSLPISSGARTIMVKGVEPDSFNRVTGYHQSLWWRPLERPLPKDTKAEDPRVPYHTFAFRTAEAARKFLDTSAADAASATGAAPARTDALREAARRFRPLASLSQAVTPEWVAQLKESAAAIEAIADEVLPPGTAAPQNPPPAWLAIRQLGDAAARFGSADASYKDLQMLLDEGSRLSFAGEGAMVLGTQVGGYNERKPQGFLRPYLFLPGHDGTLSVAPMDVSGSRVMALEQRPKKFPIANQFRSGIYEIDAQTALVDLPSLQRLLHMDEQRRIAPGQGTGGATTGGGDQPEKFVEQTATVRQPARVTNILIRGKPDVPIRDLTDHISAVYDQFAQAHAADPSPPPGLGNPSLRIATWRERNATLIGAVEKETALVMFIFGVISLTSVFLVLAIFWAMVSEKTRDIGILRAIGASRAGVAWLWIRYGLAIGIIGALLGGLAAFSIVHNINPIHEWLGSALGITIWDPRVYYFTEIPNHIEPKHAVIVLVAGVVASVLGAAIPATKAANMDPVRALRWE